MRVLLCALAQMKLQVDWESSVQLQLPLMKPGRSSLNSEIRQLSAPPSASTEAINFQRVIAKQQEMIGSLQEEILMLKSYITLQKFTALEQNCAENSISSTNSSNDTLAKDLEDSLSHGYKQYDKTTREIAAILGLKDGTELDDPHLLDALRALKEAAAKKQDPIFVERIKQIKVPIVVEKVIEKPVEKIVEKIVYVEKSAYREKERERHPRQYENEEHETTLNKTYSDRNLNKTMAGYREDKYERNQERRYDQYKRTEPTNTLIKKRSDASKNFGYRKEY